MKLKRSACEYLTPLSVLPLFFAAVLFAVLLNFDPYSVTDEFKDILPNSIFMVSAVGCTVYLLICSRFGKIDEYKVILVLFILGFAMRLLYCIKFSYSQNQHDVENLVSNGHLAYIYSLATGEGLPKTNDWQFCHPPLHHFLASLVVRFSKFLGFRNALAFENIQLLTCFYSSLLMFVGYMILKECNIKGRPLVFACTFLSFHPTFYILAGSINNDILTVLLISFCLLFLIKWYKKPSLIYALACGIFAGLGMMTKFSAALVVGVCAITVFVKLFTSKSFKTSMFFKNTAVFLAATLPLGFWYQIRNYILFKQPLGYVAPISTSSKLYIGDLGFFERFVVDFSAKPQGVYVDVWNEHNLWKYLLRNSLFGEYSFGSEAIASFSVLANLLLCVTVVLSLVVTFIKRRKFSVPILPVTIMFFVQWIMFIYFNIASPYRCSMDFRYIVPVLMCSAVYIGVLLETFENKDGVLEKCISVFTEAGVIILCLSSVLIFI